MPLGGQNFGRIGDIVASYARHKWQRDAAKHAARQWRVDTATAANALKGRVGSTTLAKAIEAEGWPLVEAIGVGLTGQTHEQHLQREIGELDDARRRKEDRINRLAELRTARQRLAALDDGQGD